MKVPTNKINSLFHLVLRNQRRYSIRPLLQVFDRLDPFLQCKVLSVELCYHLRLLLQGRPVIAPHSEGVSLGSPWDHEAEVPLNFPVGRTQRVLGDSPVIIRERYPHDRPGSPLPPSLPRSRRSRGKTSGAPTDLVQPGLLRHTGPELQRAGMRERKEPGTVHPLLPHQSSPPQHGQ
jgi:hypothetical protein